MTDAELLMLHDLSAAESLSAAELVRMLLRREHEARFGVQRIAAKSSKRTVKAAPQAKVAAKRTKKLVRRTK